MGRHHVQYRTHILRHPAVHRDQALGKPFGKKVRIKYRILLMENRVLGQQAATANPPFGIFLGCYLPFDPFDAGEHPARVLPASSGATKPLSQYRPGDN